MSTTRQTRMLSSRCFCFTQPGGKAGENRAWWKQTMPLLSCVLPRRRLPDGELCACSRSNGVSVSLPPSSRFPGRGGYMGTSVLSIPNTSISGSAGFSCPDASDTPTRPDTPIGTSCGETSRTSGRGARNASLRAVSPSDAEQLPVQLDVVFDHTLERKVLEGVPPAC